MPFLSDSFTDANDTLLEDHSPEIGGDWIEAALGDAEIGPNNFAQAVNSQAHYYNDVSPPSADYAVDFGYLVGSGSNRNLEIWARMSADGQDGYIVYIEQNSSRWYIRKSVAGSVSDIGGRWNGSINNVVAARFELEGTSLRLLVDTGSGLVERLSRTDGDITAAGHVGMLVSARFDTDGLQVDTIEAEALGVVSVDLEAALAGEGEATGTLDIAAQPISNAIDDFEDGIIDTDLWEVTETSPGTVTEQNGRIELETGGLGGYAELKSRNRYDLVGDEIFTEASNVASVAGVSEDGEQLFGLELDGNNSIYFLFYNGTIQCRYSVGGAVTTLASPAYSPTDHKWLIIRESGGTVFWEASSDGRNWSELASVAAPFDVSSLKIIMYVLEYA